MEILAEALLAAPSGALSPAAVEHLSARHANPVRLSYWT